MKIKPKKTILLPALLLLTTTLPTEAKNRTPLKETSTITTQESLLLASCAITCASTCARTNQC